jgi:preprotein translocase subunit SecE
MARNRQSAKQRQAERRARRLAGDGGLPEPSPGIDPNLAAGAPPQDEGRSDTVFRDEPDLEDDQEHLEESEIEAEHEAEERAFVDDTPDPDADEEGAAGYAPKGRRGSEAEAVAKGRPRVVQFLAASWAELQRVQWPNRQALTTLTGVVLGFVLIAGGYLGLLDAVVNKIINAIL